MLLLFSDVFMCFSYLNKFEFTTLIIFGEVKGVTKETMAFLKKTTLKTVLRKYETRNI